MITLLIVLGVFAYITIGGGVGFSAFRFAKGQCRYCQRGMHCSEMHAVDGGWAGAGWPVVIPAIIGMLIADHIATCAERRIDREKREQLAHERRMAELAEQRRIAELNMKFLEDNGIDARVVGL